jgi:hypothetical protein
MKFWTQLFDKYGFSDGCSVPSGIELFRTAYILAVNSLAAQLGSAVRAVAFDRPGMHNWCLIVFSRDPEMAALPPEALTISHPTWEEEDPDSAMHDAIAEAMGLDIDSYVWVTVTLSKARVKQLLKLTATEVPV